MKIEECVSVVTGGASGLGEAVVRLFHSVGGKVAIWDLSEELSTKIVSELGDNVIFCNVDVTVEDSIKSALKETIARLGKVQILLNCAAIYLHRMTITSKTIHPLAEFEKVIKVNLIGTFNVSRIVAKHIAEQNTPVLNTKGFREIGVIINVSSVYGYEGPIRTVAYSSSKGEILGMTLPLARDLASYGIRVNSVAPGLFGPTRLTKNIDKSYIMKCSKNFL